MGDELVKETKKDMEKRLPRKEGSLGKEDTFQLFF